MKQLKPNSPDITLDIESKVVVSYKALLIKGIARYICRLNRFCEEWGTGAFLIVIFGILGCIISFVGDFGLVASPNITTFNIVTNVLFGGFVGSSLTILISYIIWEIIQLSRWLRNWAEVNR